MVNDERFQFDVAYALAIVTVNDELPLSFPNRLHLDSKAKKLFEDCVDLGTIGASSCKIRDQPEIADNYKPTFPRFPRVLRP
jgi:hypothetical protein